MKVLRKCALKILSVLLPPLSILNWNPHPWGHQTLIDLKKEAFSERLSVKRQKRNRTLRGNFFRASFYVNKCPEKSRFRFPIGSLKIQMAYEAVSQAYVLMINNFCTFKTFVFVVRRSIQLSYGRNSMAAISGQCQYGGSNGIWAHENRSITAV